MHSEEQSKRRKWMALTLLMARMLGGIYDQAMSCIRLDTMHCECNGSRKDPSKRLSAIMSLAQAAMKKPDLAPNRRLSLKYGQREGFPFLLSAQAGRESCRRGHHAGGEFSTLAETAQDLADPPRGKWQP